MSEDDAGSSNAQREYLRQKLLEPLSLGLAEVCHVRPADPIQYLADWLRHFRELQLKKAGDRETSETKTVRVKEKGTNKDAIEIIEKRETRTFSIEDEDNDDDDEVEEEHEEEGMQAETTTIVVLEETSSDDIITEATETVTTNTADSEPGIADGKDTTKQAGDDSLEQAPESSEVDEQAVEKMVVEESEVAGEVTEPNGTNLGDDDEVEKPVETTESKEAASEQDVGEDGAQ